MSNYISEWFGDRMFPAVIATNASLADQANQRCPFLSAAKGGPQECIKQASARGVCTISSISNGPRQDWLACPYRAFEHRLLENVARRMYGVPAESRIMLFPAPVLASAQRQADVRQLVAAGETVLVYFDQKMGGEIHLAATDRSPQIAFDTTFVQILSESGGLTLGRFAILEVQTMDFHGSYRQAVQNLLDALRLHKSKFRRWFKTTRTGLARESKDQISRTSSSGRYGS